MTNLRTLSDSDLISETQKLVSEERRVSLAVLDHLRELDRRRLYASLGFSSLYEYATSALGYSEASAQRRIQAARLLSQCPELAPKIESGSLSLSVLSQAQTFFRKEEIRDLGVKREILKTLENQSSLQAERNLMARASEPARHLPERVRVVSETHSEFKFVADSELMAEIEELKGLLGESTLHAVLSYAVKACLVKKRPKLKLKEKALATSASPSQTATPESIPTRLLKLPSTPLLPKRVTPPTSEVRSRYISVETKRLVWARDKGQCTFQSAETGRRCQARFGLELDHLEAHALGGSNQPENLALKCRAHNQLAAIRTFGHGRMSRFVPSLN